MEISAEIECPWCGETCTVVVDTAQETQDLVTDCEVCCRPIRLQVQSEPGEILSLDVCAG